MNVEFVMFTDTATLAVFDLKAIKHRLSDTFDWWSLQEDELLEMNNGNIAFLNLGNDGQYRVRLVENLPDVEAGFFIKVPSGEVFVGAGEDTTGGDLEPDGSQAIQGGFIKLSKGNYFVKYERVGDLISLAFLPSSMGENNFMDSIRVHE